jgi:hypothetical protein
MAAQEKAPRGIFDFLKESPEDKQSREEFEAKVNSIEVFPGSLTEYQQLRGKLYEIVDTGNTEIYVSGRVYSNASIRFNREMKVEAAKLNASAVIRYQFLVTDFGSSEIGIPVRQKEDSSGKIS